MNSKLNVPSASPDRYFTCTFLLFQTANGINFILRAQFQQVLLSRVGCFQINKVHYPFDQREEGCDFNQWDNLRFLAPADGDNFVSLKCVPCLELFHHLFLCKAPRHHREHFCMCVLNIACVRQPQSRAASSTGEGVMSLLQTSSPIIALKAYLKP